jgi:prepilin-type processing-associated H-X9-DG protein
MANYTIIGGDGKEYGPVTAADLRQWIAEGRIGMQTKIKVDGAAEWQMLSELAEFAAPSKVPAPPLPNIPQPVKIKTSALAVTSLVLGILGLFTCGATALFGLIFGIISLVKVSRSNGSLQGKGLALAGTILSGIFLFLLPIFAAMLLPALAAAKDKAQEITCINNEKQLSLAIRTYSGNHGNQFPPAATWCDDIQTLVGSEKTFKCVAVNSDSRCDYAFNAKLDGLDLNKINPQTVVIFESDAGWNAHGGAGLLPVSVRHGHRTKAVFVVAFADGHVEAVPAAQLDSLRWDP